MSTKAIREALRRAANGEETRQDEDRAALEEAEAIERAAKVLTVNNAGSRYDPAWPHADEWPDACNTLSLIAKDAP